MGTHLYVTLKSFGKLFPGTANVRKSEHFYGRCVLRNLLTLTKAVSW